MRQETGARYKYDRLHSDKFRSSRNFYSFIRHYLSMPHRINETKLAAKLTHILTCVRANTCTQVLMFVATATIRLIHWNFFSNRHL